MAVSACEQELAATAGRLHAESGECSPVNGFWSNAAWIPCRDGKWRAVEPGDEPLVDGFAGELGLVRLKSYPDRPHQERIIYSPFIQKGKARVMRLRGYGNAIVAPQATAFIQAYKEVRS
jgi:DNA (cytosine-5)-methyltransferase 1